MKKNIEMLKPMIPILVMLGLLIFAAETHAFEQDFKFGKITTKGSGCPAGSVDIIKTENNKTASILFSEMMVEVPQFSGDNENDEYDDDNRSPTSRFDKFNSTKVCLITLNAKVPAGHKLVSADISIDYRGATFMDPGTQALFHSKFLNFTGPTQKEHRVKGTVVRKVWRFGDVDEDWTFRETKKVDLNSSCAQGNQRDTQLILKNVLKAQVIPGHRNSGASAFISLDSADAVGKMKIRFNTVACSSGGRQGPSQPRPTPPGRDRDSDQRCPRGQSWNPHINRCLTLGNVPKVPRGRKRGGFTRR